jgi:hypothetical protein
VNFLAAFYSQQLLITGSVGQFNSCLVHTILNGVVGATS